MGVRKWGGGGGCGKYIRQRKGETLRWRSHPEL